MKMNLNNKVQIVFGDLTSKILRNIAAKEGITADEYIFEIISREIAKNFDFRQLVEVAGNEK